MRTATLGTSVLTPTLRYEPAVMAQAFATLATLAPGRVFLGVGTGEAMNETPVTGGAFPGRKERRMRLAESIKLMRQLWTEERVDFDGEYYTTDRATIYDRPDEPVPVYVAASGPLAAKLAGRVGDGFICTSGKDPRSTRSCWPTSRPAPSRPGRDPGAIRRMIEVKVSYDRDPERARTNTHWWAALAFTPEQKEGVEDPIEMERLADENLDRAPSRFICSSDPDEVVAAIGTLRRPRLRGARRARAGRRPVPLHRAVLGGRAAETALARERPHLTTARRADDRRLNGAWRSISSARGGRGADVDLIGEVERALVIEERAAAVDAASVDG